MNFNEMVRPSEGYVIRKIFSDPIIYKMELESIFTKAWLYIGHESQVKHEGDYITAFMGTEPIIIKREKDNRIKVYHNSCRHRGMRVCNTDSGNSNFFRCPYHGWTYGNGGALIGVPRYKSAYFEELKKENFGLDEIKNVVNYHGTLWATWDNNAISFEKFLGDMKFYLDMLFERFDYNFEVYGGVQRWIVPTNWKFPADNGAGDSYHTSSAHESAVKLGLRVPYSDNDFEINAGNGHGFGGQRGGMGKRVVVSEEYVERTEKAIEKLSDKYGSFVKEIMPYGHMGIFPNFSLLDVWNYTTFRIWQPIGALSTEIDSGIYVYTDMPESEKEKIFRKYMLEFGPSGIFEQDDAEIWHQCTESCNGPIGSSLSLNYQIGLNHEQPASKILGKGALGVYGTPFSEVNQRDFYKEWLKYMDKEEQ